MAGLQVMSQLAERRLTRRRAAALLGLSERQVRRLYRAFRRDGAKALASRHRGRPSNRQLATATREHALTLVRARYADFGPTFAHQKLTEQHGLAFSVETLRGWMTAAGLWVPRASSSRTSCSALAQSIPTNHSNSCPAILNPPLPGPVIRRNPCAGARSATPYRR